MLPTCAHDCSHDLHADGDADATATSADTSMTCSLAENIREGRPASINNVSHTTVDSSTIMVPEYAPEAQRSERHARARSAVVEIVDAAAGCCRRCQCWPRAYCCSGTTAARWPSGPTSKCEGAAAAAAADGKDASQSASSSRDEGGSCSLSSPQDDRSEEECSLHCELSSASSAKSCCTCFSSKPSSCCCSRSTLPFQSRLDTSPSKPRSTDSTCAVTRPNFDTGPPEALSAANGWTRRSSSAHDKHSALASWP